MDGSRFDALTKALAVGVPRRRLLAMVRGVVAALGGIGSVRVRPTQAAVPVTFQQACSKDTECPKSGRGDACCNGVCRSIVNSRVHCGACGNLCLPTEECCGTACHDTQTAHDHCGRCGKPCQLFKEECCGGKCRVTVDDPKNCGACDRRCKATETCCGLRCIDLSDDRAHCGACNNACPKDTDCVGGTCVKRTAGAGFPGLDLVAAGVQPTDSALGGDWLIAGSAWANNVEALGQTVPTLRDAIGNLEGFDAAIVLILVQNGDEGQVRGVVKTVIVRCASEEAAEAITSAYADATNERAEPLDTEGLLGEMETTSAFAYSMPSDPDLEQYLPSASAIEVTYREGATIGVLLAAGDEAPIAPLAADLIARVESGNTGGDLSRRLGWVVGAGSELVNVWYSRLGGQPQRLIGVMDEQWERQQMTEGDAIDFARASQTIPSTEGDATYTLSTWAGRFEDAQGAQVWLDGVPGRLTAQNPDAQLIPVTEANGMGDASWSVLYTLTRNGVQSVGVTLYARMDREISVVGLSVAASEVTPGMGALLADPRPLGKGAQTVLGAQLGASAQDTDPVKLTADDVFEGNPLPIL